MFEYLFTMRENDKTLKLPRAPHVLLQLILEVIIESADMKVEIWSLKF